MTIIEIEHTITVSNDHSANREISHFLRLCNNYSKEQMPVFLSDVSELYNMRASKTVS